MVETYSEFLDAIQYIRNNLDQMRINCGTVFNEYIMPHSRYLDLKSSIVQLVK